MNKDLNFQNDDAVKVQIIVLKMYVIKVGHEHSVTRLCKFKR